MLLAGDPGEPRDYAVTLFAPREPEEVGCDGIIAESMILPETIRHGAERQCRFMMAGLFWCFRVSSHRGEWTNRQESFLSLRNDSRLRIFAGGEGSKNFLLQTYLELGISAAKHAATAAVFRDSQQLAYGVPTNVGDRCLHRDQRPSGSGSDVDTLLFGTCWLHSVGGTLCVCWSASRDTIWVSSLR